MLPPQSEPATWPGYTSTPSPSAVEFRQGVEEILGAFTGRDCEIGSCRVADEQRVSRQRDPVVDDERAMLGTVAGGVQYPDPYGADLQHLAVRERLERVLRLGDRVDRHRHAVFEREAPVAGKVVGVGVRLQHPLDPHAGRCSRVEVLLDPKGGIDDDGDSRVGVADEVRGAPEVVIHELPKEQHGSRG